MAIVPCIVPVVFFQRLAAIELEIGRAVELLSRKYHPGIEPGSRDSVTGRLHEVSKTVALRIQVQSHRFYFVV